VTPTVRRSWSRHWSPLNGRPCKRSYPLLTCALLGGSKSPAHWPDLAADWLERARRPSHEFIPINHRQFHSAASAALEETVNAMSTKYEDNFGFYCIDDDDPEELEFFCHIIAQSEPTICVRCSQKVRLLEHIKICATCSQALEYGAPSDPAWVVPSLWSVVRRGVRS
jgi:hypothetical protein